MTREERDVYIKALIRERRGYEVVGNDERVAAVDAELVRLGQKAQTRQKRAERRAQPREG